MGYQAIDADLEIAPVLNKIDLPAAEPDKPLKALLVDSWYDSYLGVICLVRVMEGQLKKGMRVRLMGTGAAYGVDGVGFFTPAKTNADVLGPGEIGFLNASIK